MGINYNLPPEQQNGVICAIYAAQKYSIPTNIFLAVVKKVANYHSKTPYYNSVYKADLIKRSGKWANYISNYFPENIKTTVQYAERKYIERKIYILGEN